MAEGHVQHFNYILNINVCMLQACLWELWILCWTPHPKLPPTAFYTIRQTPKCIGQ